MSANFGGSTGSYLQATSGVSLSFTHSVSLWVKPDVHRNWSAAISFGNAINDTSYARLLVNSSGGVLLQIIGTGGQASFTHSTTISTGVWTHLAYTATNSSFYSYVNGTASSQNTNAVTGFGTAVSKLTIGEYSALSTLYPFDGRIAEVGVYNGTVLSGAQISALAGGDKPDTIGSCTHYYLPIDDAGTWTDNVGALDLTKSGTVTNDDADHPAMNAGGGGVTVIPPTLHSIDNQFALITAHRLGGVLQ